MTEVVPPGGTPGRISSEYLHLAETLGLGIDNFFPKLHLDDASVLSAQALLARHGLEARPLAVFAPFTTRPQKHWSDDAWQVLAARIGRELSLTPVIVGGPSDRDAAQRIAAATPGVVSLAGATSLPEAAAVIARARLLIGVDTGLTHMGPALGTPSVALFGSTRPYLDAGRADSRVIWLGLACSPCRRSPVCGGAFHCLRDIHVQRVMTEAHTVLNEEKAA